ncbi:hypothetical protein LguiA_011702 [Lonicera macranthoides]
MRWSHRMVEPSYSSASPFLQAGPVSSLRTLAAPYLDPVAPSRAASHAPADLVFPVEDSPRVPFDLP